MVRVHAGMSDNAMREQINAEIASHIYRGVREERSDSDACAIISCSGPRGYWTVEPGRRGTIKLQHNELLIVGRPWQTLQSTVIGLIPLLTHQAATGS